MKLILNSPRGTSDIFGEDIEYRNFIIDKARKLFQIYNYGEIITPAFEYTEVFDKGIGEETDIVQKEMYTFNDKKGRSLTLRPEGTASVVRSVIEHKLYSSHLPLKLYYIENMFRYERPQKGRMREFWQLGVETIGSSNPLIDAETIWLLSALFENLGFKNLKLLLNSLGCQSCRPLYIDVFKKYLSSRMEKLCEDCKLRFVNNPLRIFDCKIENCKTILEEAPKIGACICDDCKMHFYSVIDFIKILGIDFTVKDDLVRGFDYYTGTVFEIISEDLKNVQNALGGGGRYDSLISQFGGPELPAIGFAVGIDRTVVLLKQLNLRIKQNKKEKSVYIIAMQEDFQSFTLPVLKFIREKGYTCEVNHDFKGIGNQIKWAEKNNFDFVIIIGEDEYKTGIITVKDLKSFKQYKIDLKNKDKILEIFGSQQDDRKI